MDAYKLKQELQGHSKDVKCACVGFLPELVLVSGSRDFTTRLWAPFNGEQLEEIAVLPGNGCFVNSVAVMPASAKCTDGLVMVGGQDKLIRAFSAAVPHDIVYTLEGHQDNVCSLSVDFDRDLLISGSWDKSCRMWNGPECVCVMEGHEHAVWDAVVLPSPRDSPLPLVLTCSADKSIILWENGKKLKTFNGHTQAVRSLAVLDSNRFVSCSNDCSIRLWDISTGQCVKQFNEHTGFVYKIAPLPACGGFVSCGEDGCVRVWNEEGQKQCIQVPANTVWTVAVLPNMDIVAGSSDASLRIFTNDSGRYADPGLVQLFDDEVSSFVQARTCPDQIGGVKVQDLPGKEALIEPGSRDGQTKMVRKGQVVEIHSWNENEKQWQFVGNYAGEPEAAEGKKKYMGKEYDFVFDVDVDDNRPKIKLPYNRGEDPWMAAQRFINTNELPQDYLDQISQFILKNVGESASVGPSPGNYVDPLTGAGRYIPGSVGGADPFTGEGRYIPGSRAIGVPNTNGCDPYTGEGRYVPSGAGQAAMANSNIPIDRKRPRGEDMPLKEYKRWTSVSADKLVSKLTELNNKMESWQSGEKLTETQMEAVKQLALYNVFQEEQIRAVLAAVFWERDCLIPIFDLMRLLILHVQANEQLFGAESHGPKVLQIICYQLEQATHEDHYSPPMQILLCRTLANAFVHSFARSLILESKAFKFEIVAGLVCKCVTVATKPAAQEAAASAVANFALAIHQGEGSPECRNQLLEVLVKQLDNEVLANPGQGDLCQPAIFTLLQSLVTLLWGHAESVQYANSINIAPVAARLKDLFIEERGKFVARALEQMLH